MVGLNVHHLRCELMQLTSSSEIAGTTAQRIMGIMVAKLDKKTTAMTQGHFAMRGEGKRISSSIGVAIFSATDWPTNNRIR